MPLIADLRSKWEEAGKEKEFDRRLDLMADVVTRQTTLTKEQAILALEENKFSIENAILSQANQTTEKEESKKSLNQTLFSEFRSFLDDAAQAHASRVEQQRRPLPRDASAKPQKPAASSESST